MVGYTNYRRYGGVAMTPYQEHIRWKRVGEEVSRVVNTLQGETATRFEHTEELVQDCLVHVYEKLPQFKSKNGCQEFSFIFGICRNHLINYHIFHTRGKRDYRKKINSGLDPVNFTGYYAGEDSDEVHYLKLNIDSPENILQAEQLAQTMTEKQKSDKMFREFVDESWNSPISVIDLSSKKATIAFDRLMEDI